MGKYAAKWLKRNTRTDTNGGGSDQREILQGTFTIQTSGINTKHNLSFKMKHLKFSGALRYK